MGISTEIKPDPSKAPIKIISDVDDTLYGSVPDAFRRGEGQ